MCTKSVQEDICLVRPYIGPKYRSNDDFPYKNSMYLKGIKITTPGGTRFELLGAAVKIRRDTEADRQRKRIREEQLYDVTTTTETCEYVVFAGHTSCNVADHHF